MIIKDFPRPTGRSVWLGKDLAHKRDWIYRLPATALAEIETCVEKLRANGQSSRIHRLRFTARISRNGRNTHETRLQRCNKFQMDRFSITLPVNGRGSRCGAVRGFLQILADKTDETAQFGCAIERGN
jgi:hypothetical protein